jgi:hypothetical protein
MVAPDESSLRLEREVECNAKKGCHHYFPFSQFTTAPWKQSLHCADEMRRIATRCHHHGGYPPLMA